MPKLGCVCCRAYIELKSSKRDATLKNCRKKRLKSLSIGVHRLVSVLKKVLKFETIKREFSRCLSIQLINQWKVLITVLRIKWIYLTSCDRKTQS